MKRQIEAQGWNVLGELDRLRVVLVATRNPLNLAAGRVVISYNSQPLPSGSLNVA